MKCSACANNNCQLKHENRDLCTASKENIDCRCRCEISEKQYLYTHVSYFAGGIAAAAVGTGLTLMSGGIWAAVVAPSLIGAAFPLVAMPIYSAYKNERMTIDETAKDVALNASVGAVIGPISTTGASLARTSSGLANFTIKTATSSTANAVGSAVARGSRMLRGETVTMSEIGSSMKRGAALGAVGGVSGEIANGASNQFASGLSRLLTRLGFTAASTAATDASVQFYEKGTVDPEQVLLNTAAQTAIASSMEASATAAQRTSAYSNKVNEQLMKADKIQDTSEIKKILKAADSLKESVIAKGKYAGDENIHILRRDRTGQKAADIGPIPDQAKRSEGRVLMQKVNGRHYYLDKTDTHSYKECRTTLPNEVKNPIDAHMLHHKKVHPHLINDEDELDRNKWKGFFSFLNYKKQD